VTIESSADSGCTTSTSWFGSAAINTCSPARIPLRLRTGAGSTTTSGLVGIVNTPLGCRCSTTEPASRVMCRRSPPHHPNAAIVDRFDTRPSASTRAMPYRNDPARGRPRRSATGNGAPRTGDSRRPAEAGNRGRTNAAIRSPIAITPTKGYGTASRERPTKRGFEARRWSRNVVCLGLCAAGDFPGLVSEGGLEPPRPCRALAPQASASAIPPLGPSAGAGRDVQG
jgi:hypothetical protein